LRRFSLDALAALSGVLLALSFPKFGSGAVAWVALGPLLIALSRVQGLRAVRLGYVTGAVSALGLLYWTSSVVVQFGGLSLPVGVAVMVLLCLAFAVFPALFAWLVARWVAAVGPEGLLLAPFAWVATEILRAHTFFSFPWCLLGYSQVDNPPFVQLARFGAVYAVSFVVVAASAVLAFVAVEPEAGPRRRAVLGLALLLAVVAGDGFWRLSHPPQTTGQIRVGLVQASIPQDEKWDEGLAFSNLNRHLELSERAAGEGARLVVWPESSVPYYYDDAPAVAELLRRKAAQLGVYLLFGNDDHEAGPGGRSFVGAKLIDPEGRLLLRYHKMRLVPFGEYVPLRPLLTLGGRVAAKVVAQVADFAPGETPEIGTVAGHRLSTTICYEAIFADLSREFSRRGSELFVNITNDGWYGRTSAPYQHFAMARLRAIENARYLVRAANTGITAVVDPAGGVVAATRLFESGVLVRDVPFVAETTFYTRHGDVFAWGCLGAAIALSAATLRRRG
jgi:apolipoprotein N-acyltransferase